MQYKQINNCDFSKLDDNLLDQFSIVYINDVLVLIGCTTSISYLSVIQNCIDSLSLSNMKGGSFNSLSFLLSSTAAIFNNLHTNNLINESKPIAINDTLPQMIYNPLITNIITNYSIIPHLYKTRYYKINTQIHNGEITPINLEKSLNTIYDSCKQFVGDN